MGRNPFQTQSGSWINAESMRAYQPGTTRNLMPSGISTQPLTLSKAPGKKEKASFSGGGRSGEPNAHWHAAETAEHATNSSNTVQADSHPVSPHRIHSIFSLTDRIPLVSYIMLSNSLDRGEKNASLQKHIPAGIIHIFPFKRAAPLPETDHPTSQTNNPM